jgi:hypothetical protein
MRGKRPDRFKQPQQMPAVSEGSAPVTPTDERGHRISPLPSPGMRPTIVEHSHPDASRAQFGDAAHSTQALPLRPHSSAPYPENDDHRAPPLNMPPPRARSTAPYPEDDMRGPAPLPLNTGGRPPQGPAADRAGSAFGIRTQGGPGPGPGPGSRPLPGSQSMGNLHPNPHPSDPRGRVASTGYGGPNPGNFRQPGPGQPSPPMNQFPREDMRSASAQPYGGHPQGQGRPPRQQMGPLGGIPPAGMDPRAASARPGSAAPPHHTQERFSRVPGAGGARVDKPTSLQSPPSMGRPANNSPGPVPGRIGTAPPAQMQPPLKKPSPAPSAQSAASAPSAPSKPAKAPKQAAGKQGPATFEDMGIPQGKQDGDCIIM